MISYGQISMALFPHVSLVKPPAVTISDTVAVLFSALLATLNARHELRETAAGGGAILPIPLAVMAPAGSQPAGSQHKLDGRSRDSREVCGQQVVFVGY